MPYLICRFTFTNYELNYTTCFANSQLAIHLLFADCKSALRAKSKEIFLLLTKREMYKA